MSFEGRDVDELKRSFREAIEGYVVLCRAAGRSFKLASLEWRAGGSTAARQKAPEIGQGSRHRAREFYEKDLADLSVRSGLSEIKKLFRFFD